MDFLAWNQRSGLKRPHVPFLEDEQTSELGKIARTSQTSSYFHILRVIMGDEFRLELFVEEGTVHSKSLFSLLSKYLTKKKLLQPKNPDNPRPLTPYGSKIIAELDQASDDFEDVVVPAITRIEKVLGVDLPTKKGSNIYHDADLSFYYVLLSTAVLFENVCEYSSVNLCSFSC